MEYELRKKQLLNDTNICKQNRKLYTTFFEKQEYKLLRTNNLPQLDASCKLTLNGYITRIKNVNKWFNNKPLTQLTKADIKRVYDGLENGTIKTAQGTPFKDRKSYYSKIFKSKLFEMAHKADICRQIMEFYKPNKNEQVSFIWEQDVRKLESIAIRPDQKLLIWLAFDIGENIDSGLLKLKKSDFVRQQNQSTGEPEYTVNLRKEILKRQRTPRTEITNYPETTQYLDMVLKDLKDDDGLFSFEYRQAVKFFYRIVQLAGVKCVPTNLSPTWKDLRSGMACDLLKKGWNREEVNARLGHKPSSSEIDKYVNFLAIDRHKPKEKVQQHKLVEITEQLEQSKDREKLLNTRVNTLVQKEKETQLRLCNLAQEIENLKLYRETMQDMVKLDLKKHPKKAKELPQDMDAEKIAELAVALYHGVKQKTVMGKKNGE